MIDESMQDWAIVVTNGVRLVGRLKDSRLSPVYEIPTVSRIIQKDPREAPAVIPQPTMTILPPLGYELDSVALPLHALIVPVSDLAPAERTALMNGIDGFERQKAQQRANLVIAPASAVAALNGQAAKLRGPP